MRRRLLRLGEHKVGEERAARVRRSAVCAIVLVDVIAWGSDGGGDELCWMENGRER